MKKLFFALALSFVGLFFSNFIIHSSSGNVEKSEIVNSMLPHQTLSITNNNAEQPANVAITYGNYANPTTINITLNLGQLYQNSFPGNFIKVVISTIQSPFPSQVSMPTTYKMYENSSSFRPICTEYYTFTSNGMKEFTCLTDTND